MVELNPDADFVTGRARECTRRGDTTAAAGWRAMRWASVDRQNRGQPTYLDVNDWPTEKADGDR